MDSLSGRDLLVAVKRAAGMPEAPGLQVGRPPVARLRPVATRGVRAGDPDVLALTEWRNRHVSAFLTEFQATPERTRRWLAESVGADDSRILFMLDDPAGETFGYMGLAYIEWGRGYGEVDAIVRGRPAPPGTMKRALRNLAGWAGERLELATLGVRVRSDNSALAFYRKVGFREDRRVALRRTRVSDEIHWVIDADAPPAGTSLVFMTFRPEESE